MCSKRWNKYFTMDFITTWLSRVVFKCSSAVIKSEFKVLEKQYFKKIKLEQHRAYAVTSSWQLFHTEIRRIKQVLINNGFPINIINVQIRKFLNIKFDNLPYSNCNPVKLFYCSQYSSNNVTEEKKLNNIIKRNIRVHEINRLVSLYIYYRNGKLGSLLIRNKMYKMI